MLGEAAGGVGVKGGRENGASRSNATTSALRPRLPMTHAPHNPPTQMNRLGEVELVSPWADPSGRKKPPGQKGAWVKKSKKPKY